MTITSTPYAASWSILALETLSGTVQITRYPRTAPTSARPTPVLPEVGSMMVPPGRSRPSRSAASIMATAIRSFTDAGVGVLDLGDEVAGRVYT